MYVLVVDDESISLKLASHALKQAGYEVTTARDGREALDILMRGQHRLVVCDWKMPRMDGLELCGMVRSGQFHRYIYFILLTGQDRPDDMIEGLSVGADDYIHKPFDPVELIMRVNIGRRIIGLETRDMTILALAKLAESRDSDTGAHLERVQSYCLLIAKYLQDNSTKYRHVVDDEYTRLIYQTSPLHDIGKVAIPDYILLKPGRLTEEEFEIMKTHTVRGAATLDAALNEFPDTAFLEMGRDIALSHHEKYNGTGYPRGLVGDEIPLSSRIMALADVYDALTSRRVYKEAFSHEISKAIIEQECGSHFDPDIVEAFRAEEPQFIAIREQCTQDVDKTVLSAAR